MIIGLRSLQLKETQKWEVPDDASIFPDPSTTVAVKPDSPFPGIRHKGKEIAIEDEKSEMEQFVDVDRKGSSETHFLKKVLCEEMGTDFSDTKLVFLSIHAVFLESGFVGFDSLSGLRVDFFDILKEQSMGFTTTISYTLPELLSSDNGIESIVLKLPTLGHYVNVYGSLTSSLGELRKLSIDKSRFVPAIGQFWVTFDSFDRLNGNDSIEAEKVVSEFRKIVKDNLVLPLMIDLCEKTGLNLPPCLMRVPRDVMLRILELLSGKDIARVACVCKELRDVSSDNELWKGKYLLVYGKKRGARVEVGHAGYWKNRFGLTFRAYNKKRKRRSFLRNAWNDGNFHGFASRQYDLLAARFRARNQNRNFIIIDAP